LGRIESGRFSERKDGFVGFSVIKTEERDACERREMILVIIFLFFALISEIDNILQIKEL